MSVWSLLFPDKAKRDQRAAEEAELRSLRHSRRNTVQIAESSARVGSRLMTTYAQSLEFMERGRNEDR